MKRTRSAKRTKLTNSQEGNGRRQPASHGKQGNNGELLLRHPNFVPKSENAEREAPSLACKASALSTELIAQNRA